MRDLIVFERIKYDQIPSTIKKIFRKRAYKQEKINFVRLDPTWLDETTFTHRCSSALVVQQNLTLWDYF